MKMYIFIRDSVPDGMAPVVAAHASLVCYLRYESTTYVTEWMRDSFKKVVCRVSEKEFENLKNCPYAVVTTESSLKGMEVAVTFCSNSVKDPVLNFKQYKLWKPKTNEN